MTSRPEREAPTLESVAALAGVSRATAGRVLAGAENVSERARTAVLEAAAQLSYVPNRAARSLMTRRSDTVAFVVAEDEDRFFTDPYFALVLRGAHATLSARDIQLVFVTLPPGAADDRDRFQRYARGGHVDGVIFLSLHGPDALPQVLDAAGVPVVLSGRPHPGSGGDHLAHVDSDNRGGARAATAYLVERGRRRLATITGPLDMVAALDRYDGFREGLAAASLAPAGVAHGDFAVEGGRRAMGELLASAPDVDGVFVANDLMAIGALQAVTDSGRTVPEDVAVVGYDDVPMAADTRPALTTVRQPMTDMGRAMGAMMLDLVDGGARGSVILPTELVVRATA